MHSIFALSVLAVAGFSVAQDQPQQNYPYTIDPDSVRDSDRQAWCLNQKAQCPLICLQQPGVTTSTTVENDCDPDALTYSCICDNNVAPNITMYSQTLPYYICTQWGTNCVNNCGNDNLCASACRADHPCGAQHPAPPNSSLATTMSSTSMPTGSASVTKAPPATGFGGAAATTGASSDNNNNKQGVASAMLNLGQSYGLAVVFTGIFAGFALVL